MRRGIIALSAILASGVAQAKSGGKDRYSTTPSTSQCKAAADMCFDEYCRKREQSGGSCFDLGQFQITQNVNECLAIRAIVDNKDYKTKCNSVLQTRVWERMQTYKPSPVQSAKNNARCRAAQSQLESAKKCHAAMLASDGKTTAGLSFQLSTLCGGTIANRFMSAGEYGLSNINMSDAQFAAGMNTKRANWRQIVDGVLLGYSETAESECGLEDFSMPSVGNYAPQSDNAAMIAMKETAAEKGRANAMNAIAKKYGKDDCKANALPHGGMMWLWDEWGNPQCKLECYSGFTAVDNSTCRNDTPSYSFGGGEFIGINIRTPLVAAPAPVMPIMMPDSSGGGATAPTAEKKVPAAAATQNGSSCAKVAKSATCCYYETIAQWEANMRGRTAPAASWNAEQKACANEALARIGTASPPSTAPATKHETNEKETREFWAKQTNEYLFSAIANKNGAFKNAELNFAYAEAYFRYTDGSISEAGICSYAKNNGITNAQVLAITEIDCSKPAPIEIPSQLQGLAAADKFKEKAEQEAKIKTACSTAKRLDREQFDIMESQRRSAWNSSPEQKDIVGLTCFGENEEKPCPLCFDGKIKVMYKQKSIRTPGGSTSVKICVKDPFPEGTYNAPAHLTDGSNVYGGCGGCATFVGRVCPPGYKTGGICSGDTNAPCSLDY